MADQMNSWAPYLHDPKVCCAFVVMVTSGVVLAVVRKNNNKVLLSSLGLFFILAFSVVLIVGGALWQDSHHATLDFSLQSDKEVVRAIGIDSSSVVGDPKINTAPLTLASGPAGVILTGVHFTGPSVVNNQTVYGSNNKVESKVDTRNVH